MSDNYPVDGELRRQAARIEALEQADAELAANVESVHDQVRDVRRNYHELDYRVDKLESPAPAPDQGCANPDCGHSKDLHTHPAFGLGFCLRCPCPDYVPVPAAEPAPLDPVLVAIRDLYVLVTTEPKAALALDSLSCELRQRWRKITRAGTREYEVDSAIRAYGRDGAR